MPPVFFLRNYNYNYNEIYVHNIMGTCIIKFRLFYPKVSFIVNTPFFTLASEAVYR